MQITKVDVSGELRVTYTPGGVGDESWDKQINLFTTQKSRLTTAFYDLFFLQFPNGDYFGDNISHDLAIPDVSLGVGNGVLDTFTKTVGPLPIKPGSVTITDGTHVITDSNGSLIGDVGTGNNTINYNTGAIDVTFDSAPADNAAIVVDFTRGIAADDAVVTGFVFQLGTDATPSLGDADFSNTITLTVTPASVDRYEQDNYVYYLVKMTGTYTGSLTGAVTGVALRYVTVAGTDAGVTSASRLLCKSTTVKDNSIYTDGDLKLADESVVTVTYRIKVTKS